jgi:hypothetical protein
LTADIENPMRNTYYENFYGDLVAAVAYWYWLALRVQREFISRANCLVRNIPFRPFDTVEKRPNLILPAKIEDIQYENCASKMSDSEFKSFVSGLF